MESLPREIGRMLPWMKTARWFAGKDTEGEIVLHDAALLPATGGGRATPPTWIGLVDRIRPGGPEEPARFFLPLETADGGLADASSRGPFVAWLLRTVLADESIPGGQGTFRGHAVGGLEPPTANAILSVKEIGGDASNTSLVVSWGGRSAVAKLLRRCRAGVHPEVEVGRFLAGSPVRAGVPSLLGWLDYEPGGEEGTGCSIVTAIVQERVESVGSAWDVMRRTAVDDWARCLSIAASLGEATARLHAALASREDDAAFAPEPWTTDAWATAVDGMAVHARGVLDRVERLHGTPPEPVASDLAAAIDGRHRIEQGFVEQRSRPPSSRRIRVHGDYHLGQVLVGGKCDRLTVIDFEGEPGRTLEERREKTSAAKDVAGMCRSFDYLLRVLSKEGVRPYDARDRESLESRFLASYEDASRMLAAGRPEGGWWPEGRREADRLLGLYKLDKAIYELAYEADHRPDWIDVPLAALAGSTPG